LGVDFSPERQQRKRNVSTGDKYWQGVNIKAKKLIESPHKVKLNPFQNQAEFDSCVNLIEDNEQLVSY